MVLVEQQVLGVVVALETSDLVPVQHLWDSLAKPLWSTEAPPLNLKGLNDLLLTLGYQIPEHSLTGPEQSAPQWANTTLELFGYYVNLLMMLLHWCLQLKWSHLKTSSTTGINGFFPSDPSHPASTLRLYWLVCLWRPSALCTETTRTLTIEGLCRLYVSLNAYSSGSHSSSLKVEVWVILIGP